ncbi:glycoside hydrolase family 43 protein [Paenibacillus wulumuqiensis]|uniref:glycoside hydrolase family 43 protein n=1 Tax=Paenibacillus wulumuqiensis TaxID=1567107 RepID=UPI0006199BEB
MKRKVLTMLVIMTLLVPIFAESKGFAAHWALSGEVGAHDPTLIKEGNSWYAFSTGTGIQVLKSDNGTNFYRVPQVFLTQPSWWKQYTPGLTGDRTLDVWAPDVKSYNGRVWLYYAISSEFGKNISAIGLASASSVGAGNWRDEGVVLTSNTSSNFNAIDPELVIDKDGNPWLAFGSFWSGLKLTRLDKNTMKPTGSVSSIAYRPTGEHEIEAPAITYNAQTGYYYLFASIDKCCSGANSTYKMVYGRSKSITGPYVDKNGVSMMNGGGTILDAGNDRWRGPGGQDIYNNIIIRHSYDATTPKGDPKMLISDLKFDSAGWPTY